MRRLTTILVLALGLTLLSAQASLAASPRFKKGGEPTCTVTSTSASSASVTCTATMAGLGNADVVVTTSVLGSAVYTCQNNGGNQAPGQNNVLIGPATLDNHHSRQPDQERQPDLHHRPGGVDGASDGVGGGWVSEQQLDGGQPGPDGDQHQPEDRAAGRHDPSSTGRHRTR